MQEPPFYCKWFLSIDKSVQRLLFLKIVLHSLFADVIDGLRPNSAYADPLWWISGWSICIKNFIFIQGGITLSRKWIPGYISVLHIKVSLLQCENTKKIEKSFGIRMLFPKISAENVHLWYPYKQFWPKNPDSAMKPSSNYANFIVYQYALFLRSSGSLAPSYTSGFKI